MGIRHDKPKRRELEKLINRGFEPTEITYGEGLK